jgi:hypothetical protein
MWNFDDANDNMSIAIFEGNGKAMLGAGELVTSTSFDVLVE